MNFYLWLFIFLALLISSAYFILVIKWHFAFVKNIRQVKKLTGPPTTTVTVIVPVRDEVKNIDAIFDALLHQDYPKGMVEIVFSDDHSDDGSSELITEKIASTGMGNHNIKLILQHDNNKHGKKAAIVNAIQNSTGSIIITTDADCLMSPGWIQSIVSVFESQRPSMVTGMVKMEPLKNIFEKMQALEFLSLTGTGAASVIEKKPLLCNGANLAFSRDAFIEAGGYEYGIEYASGDDVFLMLSMDSKKIVFNPAKDGIVTTTPISDIKKFVMQRIRWATKMRAYRESRVKVTGILVFLYNLVILISICFWLGDLVQGWIVAFVWGMKIIIDFIFLHAVTGHVMQRDLLWVYLPLQLIYPLYSVAGAVTVFLDKRFKWKNRKYCF